VNIIAKNSTDVIITINDLGLNILPENEIDLVTVVPPYKIASSNDLVSKVSTGCITINDGENDLSVVDAIRYVTTQKAALPTDPSGKQRVHETSRQDGTITYFTGSGDNIDDINDVGGGNSFELAHNIGDSTNQVLYMDLNIVTNKTYIHEGYIVWKDAELDKATLEVVPRTTSYEISEGTNYSLYGGYMVIPNDSTSGNIEITSDLSDPHGGLVYMPDDDLGNSPVAFWNAEWDSIDECYKNITPAPYGNGKYNIFTVEVPLARFVNKIPLLGYGFQNLQTADTDELGQGMRFRFTAETNGNHDWSMAFMLTMHRARTI